MPSANGRGIRAIATGPLAVAAGSAAANLIAYLLAITMARGLTVAEFGAVIAMLGLFLVASVPGLALQNALAREVSRSLALGTGRVPGLREAMVPVATVMAITVSLAPLSVLIARVESLAATLGLLLSAAAVTVVFALQGLVQGRSRFGVLGAILFVAGASRCCGALLGLPGGVGGVMLGHGLGLTAGAGLASLLAHRALARTRRSTDTRGPGLERGVAGEPGGTGLRRLIVLGVVGIGGFFVLANADVLVARHVLVDAQAGIYGAGALVEKVGLWLPQFLALVALPGLADPSRRSATLRLTIARTSAITMLLVVGSLLAGGPAVRLFLGPEYAALGWRTALFAATGGGLALVYVLLVAGLAAGTRSIAVATWSALATFVALGSIFAGSVTGLIGVFALCVWSLVVVGLWIERVDIRRGRRHDAAAGT